MADNNTYYNNPSPKQEEPVYPQPVTPEPYKIKESSSHIWIGGILVIIGTLFLLDKLGVDFPNWLFSFQMGLIMLGVFLGVRKQFQGVGWLIIILIGSLLLINEYFVFGQLRRFIVPLVLIGAGLFFIFRQRRDPYYFDAKNTPLNADGSASFVGSAQPVSEDFIESTSIFGGSKKKVFSKNFKGADVVTIFGGADIDLTQADVTGTAVIDVTVIFGGIDVLVPSNWQVISNAVTVFGDVKDRRAILNTTPDQAAKTLIIKGTVLFGGIEVKSY